MCVHMSGDIGTYIYIHVCVCVYTHLLLEGEVSRSVLALQKVDVLSVRVITERSEKEKKHYIYSTEYRSTVE